MKKKLIEKTVPNKPKGRGTWRQTIQEIENILVINVWECGKLYARHCINTETHDFATWKSGIWYDTKVEHAIGMETWMYGDNYWRGKSYDETKRARWNPSQKDEKRILELIDVKTKFWLKKDSLETITQAEGDRMRDERAEKEQRRQDRVERMMDKVPPLPKDWKKWIDKVLCGGDDFLVKNKDTKDWHCSACGGTIKELPEEKKAKDNEKIPCPLCGKLVRIRKRKRSVEINDRAHLIQPIDDEYSVARHFQISVDFVPHEGNLKEIDWEEDARLILTKSPKEKRACIIYWRKWGGFDCKSNPGNVRIRSCFLYDGNTEDIQEAFKGTEYEPWSRLFPQYAKAGLHLDYNCMMVGSRDERYVSLMEMLFRGRFYSLLVSESSNISFWRYEYCGSRLNINGKTIEEIFRINDKQKINRIRDRNGGDSMLTWLQWSDEKGEKLSDDQLKWLERSKVWPYSMALITGHMTMAQAINYLKRQQAESYQGKSIGTILEQYSDYMNMCKKLKKHCDDEMVYKPRELKRRHDEAAAEIAAREAELQAAEYSEKYKEAEKVLKKIRKKFEYAGESFLIVVPRKIVDIVKEGRALHHCAGATDRYFDRIKQNETYICFLRKKEAPNLPFYTIEVEPGGTIRQHRGMFDEEPEIETVKPFLQEWQKEIRKRMKEEDHKLAAVSKKKREANIEELKAKKNTRVLEGLMEDFMEAM